MRLSFDSPSATCVRHARVMGFALLSISFARPAIADPALSIVWKDGLRVVSEDKSVDFAIGGFFQNDYGFQFPSQGLRTDLGDSFPDGTEFRRARIVTKGTFLKTTEMQFSYDFGAREQGLKDVYVGIKGIPALGTLRVGHFKEPMGFDLLTSDLYLTFIERSLPSAFTPGRNTGIMATNASKRMTYALGVFRDVDATTNGSVSGRYNVTGRVTGVAWENEATGQLLHLGASASSRNPNADAVEFSARPEMNLAPRLVSTGALPATDGLHAGAEAMLIWGPTCWGGEYDQAAIESADQSDPVFNGVTASASWLLTGESRPYNRNTGTFDRLRPRSNFGGSEEGGAGAWEVALRWSRVDLDDGTVEGGTLSDVTAGLNWYLNPNFRVATNFVYADIKDGESYRGLTTRFQTDF